MSRAATLPVITPQPGQLATGGGDVRADASILQPGRDVVRGLSEATDTLFGLAEHRKKVQDTVDLAQAHVESSRELDQQRVALDSDADFKTKADRFRQTADAIRQKYSAKFDGETQARFLANYDQIAGGMEMSVRHAARQDEVQQGRATLDDANSTLVGQAAFARNPVERDGYLSQVKSNLDGAIGSGIITAAQRKIAERQYLSKFDETMAQRQIRQDPGGAIRDLGDPTKFQFMDPVRREALRTAAQSRIETLGAAARLEARSDASDMINGYHTDVAPDDAEARLKQIRALDPKSADKVQIAARTFANMQTFRAKTLPDQLKIVNEFGDKAAGPGLSGEERGAYLRMNQSFARDLQRWNEDPYSTAITTNKVVKQLFDQASNSAGAEDPRPASAARDASLDWQQANGVSTDRLAVVSNGQAKQLAQELAGLDGSKFNERLAQLKQQYGAGHFAILQRQLAREQKGAGKITSLDTALELPDTAAGVTARANLIDSGKLSDGDLKKLFTNDDDLKKTRQLVEDQMADLRISLGGTPGGMNTMARYVDDGVRLASAFQMQGLNPDQAAKRAAQQLVGDHYQFIDGGNGAKVRVPTTVDGGAIDMRAVSTNLEDVRYGLKGAELAAPADPTPGADQGAGAEAFAKRVQAYGRWVTEKGGRSALLVYEANGRLQPVLRKDGKPVTVDFTAPAPKNPNVRPEFMAAPANFQ